MDPGSWVNLPTTFARLVSVLALEFLPQKPTLAPLGLTVFGQKTVSILALIRLQIDSTDRCEYSAISVGVFTHSFHVLFDLGT